MSNVQSKTAHVIEPTAAANATARPSVLTPRTSTRGEGAETGGPSISTPPPAPGGHGEDGANLSPLERAKRLIEQAHRPVTFPRTFRTPYLD
jgi:hypothetical protein